MRAVPIVRLLSSACSLVAFIAFVFAFVFAATATASAAPTPIAAYSFDEGTGTTLTDSAGAHNGTISGATWTTAGKYGGALDFDGVNDLVTIADANDLDFTKTLTIEAWVNPDTLTHGKSILSKMETAGGNSGYELDAQINGFPTGSVGAAGNVKSVSGPAALPTGTWSHLALTSDGTTISLYINGQLVKTASATEAKGTGAALLIGHSPFFPSIYFDGRIDEVRLYNQTLNQAQIQSDADTAVGLDQIPVAAYSFDEGTGSVLHDVAGAHDGTISGATWTAAGRYGGALDFDGVNDLVTITDANELDLTKNMTLEAWVNPDTLTHGKSVLAKMETAGGNSGYELDAQINGFPTGSVGAAGNVKSVSGPAALPTGTWSHLALTSDGTTISLYINGQLVKTASATEAKGTGAALLIGHSPFFPSIYFDGRIDEVRLYNKTLSAAQIQADADNRVQAPAPQQVTTSFLDSGASSEKVAGVPITNGGTDTVVYSLPVPSITAGETLRASGNLALTNTHAYAVTDSVRLLLGSSATDTSGTVITPWTGVQQTPEMGHLTLPITGVYQAAAGLGTQYLKLVVKASSPSAKAGETLTVDPNAGRLTATRYTPASAPISEPTHLLQALADPISEKITALPVDSTWRSVLSRRLSGLSAGDILDLSGQLEVQSTGQPANAIVGLESKVTMSTAPSADGAASEAAPLTSDRLSSTMSLARIVDDNQFQVTDPAKLYLNLLVRAVPLGGSPLPLSVTKGSATLNVVRMKPSPGQPSAPLGEGTLGALASDPTPNVSSIPFALPGGAEKRVVASAPIEGGLWKGEVIRARGLLTGNLNGAPSAQVFTQLILANSAAETSGEALGPLSGDTIPAAQQLHTSVKEGTYVVPRAEDLQKYLNLVAYVSQSPPSGGGMGVPNASVSLSRSKPVKPFDEGFENGLDALFRYEYDGTLATSTAHAREGSKSMLVNLDLSHESPYGGPGSRRDEVRSPDMRSSSGHFGEQTWQGFSVYFPDEFRVARPEPGATDFDGRIDEVRLYSSALTQAQIAADRDGSYGSQPTPLAAYSFNEGSGTTAHDSTGKHDGKIEGAAWTANGKYGSALEFDGTGDAVTIPDAAELDLTGAFTIEAWANPDTHSPLSPLIAKEDGLGEAQIGNGYLLSSWLNGGPGGGVGVLGKAIAVAEGETTMPKGSWTHLALTSNGTTLSLYVNGVLQASAPAQAAPATTVPLTIGANPNMHAIVPTRGNIFAQFHTTDEGLDCSATTGPPISFNATYFEAGEHTNPGATETSTPVAGEYLDVNFRGGQIFPDCQYAMNPDQNFVLAPLQRNRWYDFVSHCRWTQLNGEAGNSVCEVWLDGKQIVGNLSLPDLTPDLYWHETPEIHDLETYFQFGNYRGPWAEDPPSQLYFDAVRRGNSYSEVAPGQ